jgi:cytochrome c oxidase assembly factor CtaG
MRKSPGARSVRQTLDFCIAVLIVLVVTFAVAVAIEKIADRAAARNVIDTLLHDMCTHPVVGCRVT